MKRPSLASGEAPFDVGRWRPSSTALGAAILILAVLFAYGNSLSGPFIFDDVPTIEENPTIRQLWPPWSSLLPPPVLGMPTAGRPLVNLSFAINYAISGKETWSYHLFNLAIHFLAALILFGIVRRTLEIWAGRGNPMHDDGLGLSTSARGLRKIECDLLSLAVALVWSVHPLQTASVTYISQRAESLMGLCYLLTLYAFIRSTTSATPRQWQALSVGTCLLGMTAKEVMVSAPLLVLLYDRTFIVGSFRVAWRKRRKFYVSLACTWLPLGVLVAMTGNRGGTAGYTAGVAWWRYASLQFPAITHYLWLSLWPKSLVFYYGSDLTASLAAVMGGSALVAMLLLGTGFALVRRSPLGFLGAWFFAILAPSSSVVPVATESMAEHRMYLPLAAVIVFFVVGCFWLMRVRGPTPERSPIGLSRSDPSWGKLGLVLAASLLLGFGLAVMTQIRNADYRSPLTIWRDTVAKRPDFPDAQLNLGTILVKMDRSDEALPFLGAAVRLAPDFAQAHSTLASALARLGRVPEAVDEFTTALRLNPKFVPAHNGLGNLFSQMGRSEAAIAHFEAALQVAPDLAEVHNNLGVALRRVGRTAEAGRELQTAVRLKPDYAEAFFNLGNALVDLGQVGNAVACYETALRLRPDLEGAYHNLAQLRSQMPDGSRDAATVKSPGSNGLRDTRGH